MLNRLVAAGTSHEEVNRDHVSSSFLQGDTHTVSSKPPPRSAKNIMSVQLNPSSSLDFRSWFSAYSFSLEG